MGSRRSGTAARAAGADDRSATHTLPRGLAPTRSTRAIRVRSTAAPVGSTTRVCAHSLRTSAVVPRDGSPTPPTGSTSALAPSASVILTRSAVADLPSTMVRSSRRRPLRSSGSASRSPPDWPVAVQAISKKLRTGSRSPLVDQSGAAAARAAPSPHDETRRSSYVPVQKRVSAPSASDSAVEVDGARTTRPPPIAWLSVWASPCDATRAREPSKSGSTDWSPAAKRCTAPATYAVPTARCSAALSRCGVGACHRSVGLRRASRRSPATPRTSASTRC